MRRRLPKTVLRGRLRTSTLLLSVVFLAVLALYLLVRPATTVVQVPRGQVLVPSPTHAAQRTPTPTPTPPVSPTTPGASSTPGHTPSASSSAATSATPSASPH